MQTENYLNLFIDESKESLQKLNEGLLELENNSEDVDTLNDIFRIAHTFKGMSKSMGFNDIGDLAHNMENILEDLRQGKIKANEGIINLLFSCSDKLQELIDKIVSGEYKDNTNDIEELVKNLQNSADELNGSAQGASEAGNDKSDEQTSFNHFEISLMNSAKEKGYIAVEVFVKLSSDCVLPGARAYMVVKTLEETGELIKSSPDIEELENGNFNQEFKLYVLTSSSIDDIKYAVENVPEIEKTDVKNVNVNNIQKQLDDKEAGAKETCEKESSTAQTSLPKTANQTIRVNSEKLNSLMDLVGELVINRTRLLELSSRHQLADLSSVIDMMGGITTDIQEIVMKLRMVPIEQLFSRFPRLVRDISKSLDKDIELKIIGSDTEIDRIVIDEIGDSLIHLVRNSLDHGVETPSEREEKGKPAKGTIEIAAFNEGDNIIIRVSDDGKGIDPEKLKAQAIKKDLITSDESKDMSENEILELIFLPGLSTAEKTTDISGRGVGMDVVKSKVASLGGNVGISSKIDTGTDITICLPSTMAIIQALLIKVGEEIYALPLNNVCEIIEITSDNIKIIQNKEVIVLREEILPIIKMPEVLEVPDYVEENNNNLTVVIVKTQNNYAGLIVSELIGQQEVVIKPVSKKLCGDDFLSGATTLGNGQIAFILNVNGLV